MRPLGRKNEPISREAALAGRPWKMPIIRRVGPAEGKVKITVQLGRPRWQRWLGASEVYEKTYALDAFGCEVYDACDGRTTARAIARDFARKHHLGLGEAELSVTTFLRTMMAKGLIAMELDQGQS